MKFDGMLMKSNQRRQTVNYGLEWEMRSRNETAMAQEKICWMSEKSANGRSMRMNDRLQPM